MKGCRVVRTRRGSRCMCGNRFAKNARCGLPPARGKRR